MLRFINAIDNRLFDDFYDFFDIREHELFYNFYTRFQKSHRYNDNKLDVITAPMKFPIIEVQQKFIIFTESTRIFARTAVYTNRGKRSML